MTLKSVPKPQGFDLRQARADKSDCASHWLPEDALYDASLAMRADDPVIAAAVIWYVRDKSGKLSLRYRVHEQHSLQAVALVVDMLQQMARR